MTVPLTKCWFVVGATASGKSSVGIELARRINGEIISLDSMAVYRRMDIGTAKPTEEQLRAAEHHLIDVVEPSEDFSLAQYVGMAERKVEHILMRNRAPIFVGGTPLYLKGLLRGIFEGPPADPEFRREMLEAAEQFGPDWLHQEVAKIDPAAAARLHPNDTKRLIRALEVRQTTGVPISVLQKQFDAGREADSCRVFVLDWPKAELHDRINRRVDEMFDAGLVGEVECLLDEPAALSKTAAQAVGYREVIEYLHGERDWKETVELVKLHTRQLAKRQNTWYRSLSECRFVPVSGSFDAVALADRIAETKL